MCPCCVVPAAGKPSIARHIFFIKYPALCIYNNTKKIKTDPRVGKVVHEIKEPATKAHDLNLTPRTHMGKENTNSFKLSSDRHMYTK